MIGQRQIVGKLDIEAEAARSADHRRQKARLALDGRIRRLEERRIENRHALEFEECVAKAHDLALFIPCDAKRAHSPGRRLRLARLVAEIAR